VEQGVDILHTHHNSTGSLARIAVADIGVKVVNTEHTDHTHFSVLQRIVNSFTYPLIDSYVSNSNNTAESTSWYEDLLLFNSEREIIYNGVDTRSVEKAGESRLDLPDGPIIVTVGRLVEAKNHRTLLHSFQLIVERVPNATLVIIGSGPLSNELRQSARDLGVVDSIVFAGHLTRPEVYSVLNRSTIAVFPSWYEGFCVAAIEAMAAGLPVIVSDIDVLHEVVGDTGVFVNPNDSNEIADAIVDLLKQPDRRGDLGTKAKERVRSTFSLDLTAQQYCSVYKDVANSG
jgi:glycosyltransferase involved in cell wall biosynthesis